MKLVSLSLIASLAFPAAAAAAAAATDTRSPRDSSLAVVSERVRAALAKRQPLGTKRLRGLSYLHGAEPAGPEVKNPRFEAQVDVWGKAPRDPNEAISAFLNNSDRAVYQGGQYTVTPYGSPAADFVPLVKWVAKKVRNRTEENQEKPPQQSQ
jgi:antitoxin (DNA-binding transcriptional repressor) of toxin-antitoxin stability system